MNSNNRIVATLYSLGTQFVSGIQVQIPCIKEMMMMIMIIIKIIFIVTRWQWLIYMYTKHEIGYY